MGVRGEGSARKELALQAWYLRTCPLLQRDTAARATFGRKSLIRAYSSEGEPMTTIVKNMAAERQHRSNS